MTRGAGSRGLRVAVAAGRKATLQLLTSIALVVRMEDIDMPDLE
jgi:hypothetical protein